MKITFITALSVLMLLFFSCSGGKTYKNSRYGYKVKIPAEMVIYSSPDDLFSIKGINAVEQYFTTINGADAYFCNPASPDLFKDLIWIKSRGAGFEILKLRDPDYETAFLLQLIQQNTSDSRIYQAGFETMGKRKVYRVDFIKTEGNTQLFMTTVFLPMAFHESQFIRAVYSGSRRKQMLGVIRNMVTTYKR